MELESQSVTFAGLKLKYVNQGGLKFIEDHLPLLPRVLRFKGVHQHNQCHI